MHEFETGGKGASPGVSGGTSVSLGPIFVEREGTWRKSGLGPLILDV